MNETLQSESTPSAASRGRAPLWQRLLPWLITLACFAYLYTILNRAAAAEESSLLPYLLQIFERVSWWQWLGMMVPYTLFFFILDTFIIWKVINWFNVKISYMGILPIRASAFILSLLNEQVGKGAIALYLNRRDGIPGWEVASSMLFVMFCEFYYLTTWATVGVLLEWQRFPAILHSIPWIALGAVTFFVFFYLYFSGRILKGLTLREKSIFRAFRQAELRHYLSVIAMRSPVMLSAVMVYTLALGLFGVEVSFG
ncbi:hypothetical protein MYX82_07900, partial [Acidobacteria bacterium AH-259-D05]|nr:hypothetical protein [Acidobacteria bacterium AH-259-D05]